MKFRRAVVLWNKERGESVGAILLYTVIIMVGLRGVRIAMEFRFYLIYLYMCVYSMGENLNHNNSFAVYIYISEHTRGRRNYSYKIYNLYPHN